VPPKARRPRRKPAPALAPARPGSIEEIERGPSGKAIAAVFDFDGTLIAGYSALDVAQARLMRGQVSGAELLGMVSLAVQGLAGRADFKDLIAFLGKQWKGKTEAELMKEGERLFQSRIADRLYPEMKRRLEAHRAKGHTLILASSATAFQVEPAAKFLGFDHVLCTRFETRDGKMTGKPANASMWGEGKANAVRALAKKLKLDLRKSWAYADGNEEVPLMQAVGNPRPTNPHAKLEAVAKAHNWPTLKFESRGRPSPAVVMRTMTALYAMGPLGMLAAATGIINNDVRSAINFMTPAWMDLAHSLAGVDVRVDGEPYLWSHRPAVFIFNHKTNFDALIIGKLLRTDFTGVAKKELERHPIMGPAGRLMKVAFIDRGDPKKAVESMKPIMKLAQEGISIAIAPEGTRAKTRELLPFKKGAFRIAMAAGIPIVPIVIRNAEDIGARDAFFMRPGTVEVKVLPPISVADWSLDDLEERIDAVRDLFVATLKDWPNGGMKLLGVKPPRRGKASGLTSRRRSST
jgi:putative phosphoserine phosphatase/1-acylglycerol-3-phosphate O-acyltransferase